MDPGERGVQLAARREHLQRVQPHESLGTQRGGDLGVELGQVERARAQPGDHVVLGESVLGLVVELDRHHACASWRAAVAARRPSAGARSSATQVPVQAHMGVGALEALAELWRRSRNRRAGR